MLSATERPAFQHYKMFRILRKQADMVGLHTLRCSGGVQNVVCQNVQNVVCRHKFLECRMLTNF